MSALRQERSLKDGVRQRHSEIVTLPSPHPVEVGLMFAARSQDMPAPGIGLTDMKAKGGAAMRYLIALSRVSTVAAFFLAVASSLDAMPSAAADMAF